MASKLLKNVCPKTCPKTSKVGPLIAQMSILASILGPFWHHFFIRRTPPGVHRVSNPSKSLSEIWYWNDFEFWRPPYPPDRPKNPLRAAGSRACWSSLVEVPHLVYTPLCCFFSLVVFLGRFSTESSLLRDPRGDRGRMLFWDKNSILSNLIFRRYVLDFGSHLGLNLWHFSRF